MHGECRHWRLFAAGIVCTALGIALVTQAGRGTSAVASPAYVLSQIFPWSMGAFTVCINLGMMALQALLMGRAFFPRQMLQLPASLVFGALLDVFCHLLSPLRVSWFCLALGCCVLGLGVGLQRLGGVLLLPSEGAVLAVSRRLRLDFGRVKVGFDIALVTTAAVLSWSFLGYVTGIREGTLVVAALTGPISRGFYEWLRRFA